MRKKRIIFTAAFLCAVLSGCKTAPVKQEIPERWEKTYQGMTLEEFKQVWPDARYAGETLEGKNIYTVKSSLAAGNAMGFDYFLFEDKRFVSSGFFLYTLHGNNGVKEYKVQLFVRKPGRPVEERPVQE
jgi:hypothetical protein